MIFIQKEMLCEINFGGGILKHWKPERIGICMAIYEPNHEDFLHQLDSISRQTHTNWVCQISSDSDLSQIRKNRIFESYFGVIFSSHIFES